MRWWAAAVFLLPSLAWSQPSDEALTACLQEAYPQQQVWVDQGVATLGNGATIALFSPGLHPRTFAQQLARGDFVDQLSQPYPSTFFAPRFNADPGRIRQDALFKAMYGTSPAQVRRQLRPVLWAPSGKTILFSQVNGADRALGRVGQELAQDAALSAYVGTSLGAFNFRTIAGTDRLSTHSFAVAIDFKLPTPLHVYWQWSGCRHEQPCPYPPQLLSDPALHAVVRAFEAHGFVWGGKWHHYDAMHFEYRPELLAASCRL